MAKKAKEVEEAKESKRKYISLRLCVSRYKRQVIWSDLKSQRKIDLENSKP